MAFFGKRPKPQGFQYIPRYYDPEKEDREARLRAAKAAAGGDTEAIKNRIHAHFRQPRKLKGGAFASSKRKANFRVLIILIILLALTYILLSDFLPQIEKVLE